MNSTEDIDALRRSLGAYKGIVEVSSLINEFTQMNELIPAILDVGKRVMNAEASSMFLVTSDGDLELVVARGPSAPDGVLPTPIVVPRGKGISGWVLEHGKSQVVVDAYEDPRFYREADKQSGFRTRSILCSPLTRRGKEIGVIQVLNPLGKNAFDQVDLEAFEAFATLVSTAIDKVRALQRQQEQERVKVELDLAREIQESFLPQTLPTITGLSFGSYYHAARNIGGDFYDVMVGGPDAVWFVLGDVSGKGIPAALLMAQAVSSLRFIVRTGVTPEEAIAQWNNTLCEGTVRGMFITALLGRISPSKMTIEIANAGHMPPVNAAVTHKVGGGLPLGIMAGTRYTGTTLTMERGENLIFFTDGLNESRDLAGAEFGIEGIQRIAAEGGLTPASLAEALAEAESKHRGDQEPRDDLTILTLGFA